MEIEEVFLTILAPLLLFALHATLCPLHTGKLTTNEKLLHISSFFSSVVTQKSMAFLTSGRRSKHALSQHLYPPLSSTPHWVTSESSDPPF